MKLLTQLQLGVHIGPFVPPNPQPKTIVVEQQQWTDVYLLRRWRHYPMGRNLPGSAGSNIVVSGETPLPMIHLRINYGGNPVHQKCPSMTVVTGYW